LGRPVRILARPSQSAEDDLYEEDKEDPSADRSNAETFPDDHNRPGWSFEDMLSANSKLGYQSTYSDAVFEKTYSSTAGLKPSSTMILDGRKIVEAFKHGWWHPS
jgi:hypothetical protein